MKREDEPKRPRGRAQKARAVGSRKTPHGRAEPGPVTRNIRRGRRQAAPADGGQHRLWSGSVSFGLVTVPVAIVAAILPRRTQFHLIHKTDSSRLSRRMICSEDNQPVPLEHMQRGFEIEPGRHVIIRDAELESLMPERSKTIEIQEFVPADAIDPAWYEAPYYLVPTGPEKPYQLLVETMAELKMAGLSRFVMHAREHLCCVQSIDGALCLITLRFADELRSPSDVVEPAEPSAAEVSALKKAIARDTGRFAPEAFVDEYQKRVDELIARKKRRHETVEVHEAEREEGAEEGEPLDLESALEESLARERAGRR